jgi:hypothetical protein
MVSLAEHPLVTHVRRYAEDSRLAAAKPDLRARADASRTELVSALDQVRAAALELEDAAVDVAVLTDERREKCREGLGRLLSMQGALYQALAYVPERFSVTRDVRATMLDVMTELGEVVETAAFKVDADLSAELQRRLASITAEPPAGDWRDILADL